MTKYFLGNRLFIKIFLWFWLAALLINVIFFVLPIFIQSQYFPGGWRNFTSTALKIYGSTAVEIYEKEGSKVLYNFLKKIENESEIKSYLVSPGFSEISTIPDPEVFQNLHNEALKNDLPQFQCRIRLFMVL